MKLAENLFTYALEELEMLLAEDFHLLSSEIKNIPESKRQDYASDYSNLIQLLQYHDLIRQKVQHVQQLNLLFDEEVKDTLGMLDYASVAPDLFVLMIELLRFSKQEYAKVITKVKSHLSKLEQGIYWDEKNFNLFYENILALIYKMEKLYIKIGQQQQRNHLQLINAQEKMQKVYQTFSMESERDIFWSVMKSGPHEEYMQKLDSDEGTAGHIDLF
jgi:hypothetical protein